MARQIPSTPRPRPRIVDWIPGTVNLRDLGGYATLAGGRVRMGLLYRSGFTHGIPNHGLAELAQDLGIRTVIDLRTDAERKRGLSDFEAHGLRPVHEPMLTSLATDEELAPPQFARRILQGGFDWLMPYRSILELNTERLGRILKLLAEPSALPVLIHCTGGRDRTGLLAASVQALLGMPDEQIAEDYALSNRLLDGIAPNREFEQLFAEVDIRRDEIARALTTRPETMLELLAHIRREYGSIDDLLLSYQVPAVVVEHLRARLIES